MAWRPIIPVINSTTGVEITTAATVQLRPGGSPTGQIACTQLGTSHRYKADSALDETITYHVYIDSVFVGYLQYPVTTEDLDSTISTIGSDLDDAEAEIVKVQQLKTVVSTTDPTPDYIGQLGKDASGAKYLAIALTGTMWQALPRAGDGIVLAADGTQSVDPDDNTIEISGGKVQVKDDGIVEDKIGTGAVTVYKLGSDSISRIELEAENSAIREKIVETKTLYNLLKQVTESGYDSQFNVDGGMTLSAIANDSTLPFSSSQLSHFYRIAYDSAVANQQVIKYFNTANQGHVVGVWIRDASMEATDNGISFYNQYTAFLSLSKTEFATLGTVVTDTSGVYTFTVKVAAKYNGWTFLRVDATTTSTDFAQQRFHMKINAGTATGNFDFCNTSLIDGNFINGNDIYISSADTVGIVPSFHYKVEKEFGNSALYTSMINYIDAAETDAIEITKELADDRLTRLNAMRDQTIYNLLAQPTETNFVSQFAIGGTGVALNSIANDSTLPFPASKLSNFLRMTYDCSNINQQITKTITGTPTKYITSFWLRDSDIVNLPVGIEVYHLGTAFTAITKENLAILGAESTETVGDTTVNIRVFAQYNNWTCVVVTATIATGTFTDIRAYLKITGSSGAGKLDIANYCVVSERDDIDPSEIYISSADTVGIVPTFDNKTLRAVSESMIIEGFAPKVAVSEIIKSRLEDNIERYNLLKQPTESGYDTQFLTDASGTISSIANDGTLPFPASKLANFIRLTYDAASATYMVRYITGTPTKQIVSLWLRDEDIENTPTGIRFYASSAAINTYLSIEDYSILYNVVSSVAGDLTMSIKVVCKRNGWTCLHIVTSHATGNLSRIDYYLRLAGGTGTGKIDIANICMIAELDELNSDIIYISATDTVGIVPTFDNKAVEAVESANIISPIVASLIPNYTYGAKLQNFLAKARNYRSSKFMSQAPKVILIGDSIFGGDWTDDLTSWLNSEFNIPTANIETHWYGGTDIQYMLPFIENIAILNNPDLILFGEYESATDARLLLIESCIKLFRDYTTADIAIVSWSMTDTIADTLYNSGSPDIALIEDNAEYENMNWYRDIAKKYDCELIDTNQAIVEYVLAGNDPTGIYLSGPHLTSAGYTAVFTPEVKKHFQDSNWQTALNFPNPRTEKEEIIFAHDGFGLERYKDNRIAFNNVSLWDYYASYKFVRCQTQNEFVEFSIENAIGFEVWSVDKVSGTVDIAVKPEGGAYGLPSALTQNSYPLQYCGEIVSTTYASNADNWRMKRPFKKGVVNSNILSDGTRISGQYTIKVTDIGGIVAVDTGSNWVEINGDLSSFISASDTVVINGSTGNDGTYTVDSVAYQSGSDRTRVTMTTSIADATADGYLLQDGDLQFVTCDVIDPGLSVLDTFIVGFEDVSVLAGALTFPLLYNGEENYTLTAAELDDWGQPANSNFEIDDEYEFYIHNNWCDTLDITEQANRVFGFDRGNYTVKLTVGAGILLDLFGIKVFH